MVEQKKADDEDDVFHDELDNDNVPDLPVHESFVSNKKIRKSKNNNNKNSNNS